jgi:meso-butanediol dehydrogenase / (S,S)-butanediol dehydrogenase / diacetyl reductase
MITFQGKAGIVTGAGSGMGRATATGFAKLGGAVVVADINEENARKVAREIAALGGKAVSLGIDVTKSGDIDRMFDVALQSFGRVDFLHNNAYGVPPALAALSRLAKVSDGSWAHGIEVGLTAVFRGIRKAIPLMRAQGGGAIVNTASISAMAADLGPGPYAAAKAGVINLDPSGRN